VIITSKHIVKTNMRSLHPDIIRQQMHDSRQRTLRLIDGLTIEQSMGQRLATTNPLPWEIAHAAYFYEFWVLRQHGGQTAIRADVDQLFDSINIAHDDRWDLPLPSLPDTLDYMAQVLQAVDLSLQSGHDPQRDYLAQYAVFHEDMHTEAFTYTRQTQGYPASLIAKDSDVKPDTDDCRGDVTIPAGHFKLGASKQDGFVFDNEKWAHDCQVAAFSMARCAVSNADYLAFVEANGYQTQQFWCETGWQWLQQANLSCPIYWRQHNQQWQQRCFNQWQALQTDAAVIHVSWYEAQAYCHWADRRLPTELEWEVAAAGQLDAQGQLSPHKRYFPWGEADPTAAHANLDGDALGTIDVAALANGDSAFGCRQMIGNVWEWTSSDFLPYPDFSPDMYSDYSQPLFGKTKVLRGGAWTTRGRMIRNTWRTYYGTDRNDIFAGFRTCAK